MTTDKQPIRRERLHRYKLDQLQPGDRFYFAGDRSKTIYTLNLEIPFETFIYNGMKRVFAICNKDGSKLTERHKANRPIIFLRSILKN